MDQIKIGQFIAQQRKNKKYTQKQLADIKAYVMGPHTITKRKLTCPHCKKKNWNKKVYTK